MPSQWSPLSSNACKKRWTPAPVHGTEPTHTHTHTHTHIYIYLSGVENLCCYTLSPRGPNHHELGSWGLGWTCGASLLGASLENHHGGVLFREQCCVARSFIRLGAPGEGSQGHEALHYETVLEFVPDRVGVVWASLLKEPLEVVCSQPRRAPTVTCGGRDVPHARATHFPATVLVVTGHDHGS
jgi:hypothetical protein